jgi:hypothetical protein
MRSFRQMFPSTFLKSSDLNGRPIIGTIVSVDTERIGSGSESEEKPIVTFKEPGLKRLVLNRINSEEIADIVGSEDVDAWVGHKIELFATTTEFKGKKVPCLRVRAPQALDSQADF